MKQYTISPMEAEEADEVRFLMERCFARSFHSIFFIHPQSTIVARYNGTIVAGLNLDIFQVNKRVRMAYIGWLYTDSEHRGQGLANKLLSYALFFAKEAGCTDVAGCVEGDNPASFLQLQRHGFAPLSLAAQVRRFGSGIVRVNKHASRFFDMGYFLWHRRLDTETQAAKQAQSGALLVTILANLLCVLPLLFGLSLPALVGLPTFTYGPATLLAVALTIVLRDLAMQSVARFYRLPTAFATWDTAYLPALLLPLLVGVPFPAAGNRYITAPKWSRAAEAGHLSQMAFAANLTLATLLLLFPNPYTVIMLLLDTVAFAYPFTGFNASRIRGGSLAMRFISPLLLLASTSFLLVY